ncbi:urease accessory protein UreF [Lysinibacillus sp. ACHW1.5]|uniref:urease accessory protein UreF n=1 Tax=Lysinibacillus sp. ACHW1.5 TaxID=2913506 RepID=UPI001EDC736E|nr:urease accessory protein UreF [Lysinibacillus sp. ACHW1.5]UKJ47387.1 urease accessory protein UreF [Lysinibacillus sp. ACHW1.5]
MKQLNDASSNRSNTVDTLTNFSLLQLLQIHDSAFPIGSYTHSYGMETYIQEDIIRTKEQLVEFCQVYLFHNVVYGDAILIQEAFHAAKRRDVARLIELDQLCGAMKLAKESRDASVNVGKQFMRTVAPLMESPFLLQWKEKIDHEEVKGHYAVLYGIYCEALGVNVFHAIMTFMYASISGLVQNAVRAVPFGQNTGVQALHELLASVEEAAKTVLTLTMDDLANNALGIELASMKHEFLFSRLFIS